ncbi:MAG: hypothetical protein CR994_00510 [Maribacter sp.]|nr:MAG: hypothetical protein CR994_00510 [Maribacter sp.]
MHNGFIFKKGVKNYITDDFEKEFIRRIEIAGYTADIKNDTIHRDWKYSNENWCPNYDSARFEIDKWKKCRYPDL